MLKLLLLSCALLSFAAEAGRSHIDFSDSANRLAQQIVTKAYEKSGDNRFLTIKTWLKKYIGNYGFYSDSASECQGSGINQHSIGAWTNNGSSVAHICRSIFLYATSHGLAGKAKLAQVLIHEATHSSGISNSVFGGKRDMRNECGATLLEYRAMKWGYGSNELNGYHKDCYSMGLFNVDSFKLPTRSRK